jgi:hypothetical protein
VRNAGDQITLVRAAVPTPGVWELAIPDPAPDAPLVYVRDNVADLGWIDTALDGGPDPYSAGGKIWHYQCADIKVDAQRRDGHGAERVGDRLQRLCRGAIPLHRVLRLLEPVPRRRLDRPGAADRQWMDGGRRAGGPPARRRGPPAGGQLELDRAHRVAAFRAAAGSSSRWDLSDPLQDFGPVGRWLDDALRAADRVGDRIEDAVRCLFGLGHKHDPDDALIDLPPGFEPVGWIRQRSSLIEVRGARVPPGERVRALFSLQAVSGHLAGGSTFVVRVE